MDIIMRETVQYLKITEGYNRSQLGLVVNLKFEEIGQPSTKACPIFFIYFQKKVKTLGYFFLWLELRSKTV